MCSIMCYCSAQADEEQFMKGFSKIPRLSSLICVVIVSHSSFAFATIIDVVDCKVFQYRL